MQEHTVVSVLKIGSALVVGFGVVIAIAAYPPMAGIAQFLLDLIKWPVDAAQAVSSPEMRLLSAVSGGVMVGWGLLLWLVAARLYRRDPALAGSMILTSIGAWFVIDSTASVVAGAPLNAVLNVSFLVLFALPVMLHRRAEGASTSALGS